MNIGWVWRLTTHSVSPWEAAPGTLTWPSSVCLYLCSAVSVAAGNRIYTLWKITNNKIWRSWINRTGKLHKHYRDYLGKDLWMRSKNGRWRGKKKKKVYKRINALKKKKKFSLKCNKSFNQEHCVFGPGADLAERLEGSGAHVAESSVVAQQQEGQHLKSGM